MKIGDVIQFDYTGETQPNPRFLRIQADNGNNIQGMDLTLMEDKTFKFEKMFNIKTICSTVKKLQHKVGNHYRVGSGRYILAQVGSSQVCLINLLDGNGFNNPIRVKNIYAITQEEFFEISYGDNFELVENE